MIVGVCLIAASAFAQVINVRVNGADLTPVASGDPIDVSIVDQAVNTIRLLGTTGETDIGRLRIHGAVPAEGRIDVLIGTVNEEPNATFPNEVDDVLLSAGRHWGGMEFDNAALQGHTRVAFAISGDLKALPATPASGQVEAGQIYRGQVGGSAFADIRTNSSFAFPDGEQIAPYVDFNRDGSENAFDIESVESALNGICP